MEVPLIEEPTYNLPNPYWCRRCKVYHEWCPVLRISDEEYHIVCPETKEIISENWLVEDFKPAFQVPWAEDCDPPDPDEEPFEKRSTHVGWHWMDLVAILIFLGSILFLGWMVGYAFQTVPRLHF